MCLSNVVATILSIKWGINTLRAALVRAGPPSQRQKWHKLPRAVLSGRARLGCHHTKPQICSVFPSWSSEGLCDGSPPAGVQDGRAWVRGWVQAMRAGGAEAKVLVLSPG